MKYMEKKRENLLLRDAEKTLSASFKSNIFVLVLVIKRAFC